MKRVAVIIPALLFVIAIAGSAWASDSTKAAPGAKGQAVFEEMVKNHEFIGDKKCKMCHKDEHASWMETKHANAWDALKPEEKKNKECVGCHSTGTIAKSDSLITGVSCEACHGPGNDYKSIKTMKDKAASIEAGLIIPTAETCQRCHNPKSPTFKEFDFETFKAKGVHEIKYPEKSEK